MNLYDGYIHKQELKDRGWTNSLIEKYYPIPDKTRGNSRNRRAPICYYSIQEVTAIELTGEFLAEKERISHKVLAAKATAERKAVQVIENVRRSVRLQVDQQTTLEMIETKAIASYNSRAGNERRASQDSDRAFLDRIAVNYLRHECSNYEELLYALMGCVGKAQAGEEARKLVHSAIDERFPDLCATRFDRDEKDVF